MGGTFCSYTLDHSSAQFKRREFADGDSDKEVLDDGWVEETFVAEENKESPEEVP